MKLIIEYPFSDAERATLMGLLTGNTRGGLTPVPQQPTGTLMVDGVPVDVTPGGSVAGVTLTTGFNPFVPQNTLPNVPNVADIGAGTLPVPPVPQTVPTPPAGITVDSEGLPWDKRIHASTKTRRQSDDTWKLMKGVSDHLVRSVKAELRQAMSAGVTAPTPPVLPVQQPTASGMTVNQLIEWVNQRVIAQELTHAQINNYLHNSHGIATLGAVPAELVAEVHKFLSSICIPFMTAAVTAPTTTAPPVQNATAAGQQSFVPAAPVSPVNGGAQGVSTTVDPFPFGAPAAAPAAGGPTTYADICEWMVSQVAGGTMTKQQVQDTVVAHGLPTVPSLEHRPDLIPVIYQALVAVQS